MEAGQVVGPEAVVYWQDMRLSGRVPVIPPVERVVEAAHMQAGAPGKKAANTPR